MYVDIVVTLFMKLFFYIMLLHNLMIHSFQQSLCLRLHILHQCHPPTLIQQPRT